MAKETPVEELIAITARMVAFLEASFTDRNSERDIPASEALCLEFLGLLDRTVLCEEGGDSEATSSWESAIKTVGTGIAEAFANEPSRWARISKLAAVYLRSAKTQDHPRADQTTQLKLPDGATVRLVRFNLAEPIIRAFLLNSSPEDRVTFYRSIDEWDVWRAVAESLELIVPEPTELADALTAARAFVKTDWARGRVIDPLVRWSSKNRNAARQIVDGWIVADTKFRAIDGELVRLLVEAIVGPSADAETMSWRAGLIDTLSRRNDESSWELAVVISCFAWPEQALVGVEQRHAALLEQIERFPGRLVGVGLRAMCREARLYPTDALRTTARLLDLKGPVRSSDIALVIAEIADWAMHASQESGIDQKLLAPLEPALLEVTPERARGGLGLDSFLASLTKFDPSSTRGFVVAWLERHASSIRQAHRSFDEIFPLLAHALGSAQQAEWIVSFMVSRSAALRSIGAQFFLSVSAENPITPAFAKLDEREALALCHLLAATGVSGNKWIPTVLKLVAEHPSIIDSAQSILSDAASNFPGSCGDAIDRWNTSELSQDAQERALKLQLDIKERIVVLENIYSAKRTIPELIATRPATAEWARMQQRIIEISMRTARQSALFLQIATRVPIARGNQTLMHSLQDVPTKLERFSGSADLPIVASFDPLSWLLARLRHLDMVDTLLGKPDEEVPS